MTGIRFLTEVGHITTDQRQEFILLSDTLGLSMLVDLINHGAASTATESTVQGPFYVEGAPWRSNGDAITDDVGDQPLLVTRSRPGHIRRSLAGATVDVWQNATNRLYAVQDETQAAENLRGRFRTDGDGAFAFRTVRPVDYPIPDDGPVGRMLQATGRHPWRPAHIHLMVSADGHVPVTTHVFDSESRYLESDAVFGVKPSLVRTFAVHEPRRCSGGFGHERTLVHHGHRHRSAGLTTPANLREPRPLPVAAALCASRAASARDRPSCAGSMFARSDRRAPGNARRGSHRPPTAQPPRAP